MVIEPQSRSAWLIQQPMAIDVTNAGCRGIVLATLSPPAGKVDDHFVRVGEVGVRPVTVVAAE